MAHILNYSIGKAATERGAIRVLGSVESFVVSNWLCGLLFYKYEDALDYDFYEELLDAVHPGIIRNVVQGNGLFISELFKLFNYRLLVKRMNWYRDSRFGKNMTARYLYWIF